MKTNMTDCAEGAMSSMLGLLAHLNIEELKEVLNDDAKFENATKEPNVSDKYVAEKEMITASNKSLAEYNLSRSEEFKEKKSQLATIYEELKEINSSIEAKIAKIKELSKKTDSESVLMLLHSAVSEIERETDDISDKLVQGDTKLEAFLEQYPSQRKLMHLRKAKFEKMSEMVSRRQSYKVTPVPIATPRKSATPSNVRIPCPYPPSYSNAPVNVPYPLEPVNMPIPNSYMPNHF